jgi:putative MFS transporter
VLRLLAAASFFQGYDLNVITVALPQLRHTFGLTQAHAADWLAVLFLGALPAVYLARRADRFGRRRLLLVSIVGYTVATAATALAPTLLAFGICQIFARMFLALEVTLTWTVVAEELPARARGFGFGILALLDVLGVGTASIFWGLVLSPHHASWRWLYAAAAPVLLVVAILRRRLPESSRYTQAAAAGRLATSWRSLLRPPYGRLLVLVCVASAGAALLTQAQVFVIDFLQTQRHLSASVSNLILVSAGALALPVLVGAGALSDRLGRKRIGCSFLGLGIVGVFFFFFLARGTPALFVALAVTYAGSFGAWPTLSGYTTELFPTSHRALASSTATIATVAGQAGSLLLAGQLIGSVGLAGSVAVLAAGPLIALLVVAVGYPETAGRELEVTSAEAASFAFGVAGDAVSEPEAPPEPAGAPVG